MIDNRKKLKIRTLIIIGFLICVFILGNYLKNAYQNKIKNYSGSTIGLASSIKYHPKTKDLVYYFYYNDTKIVAIYNENNFTKNNLNKFYIVKFNLENPKESHIYLTKKLNPDSISLVKAGFKYAKYYEHDISTNTYVKKYKWH